MKSLRWENLLFLTIIFAYLALVWGVGYFPTVDGPSHIANSYVFKNLLLGNCPKLSEFYQINPFYIPNYGTTLIASLASFVFSPEAINKIIISLYIILFASGIWKLVRSINPQSLFITIPAMVVILNALLFFGNYNFLLSSALYLHLLNWWIKNYENKTLRHFLLTGVYLTLLYFVHIFGVFLFCLSVATMLTYQLLRNRDLKTFLHYATGYTLAALPMLVMLYFYMQLPKIPAEGSNPLDYRLLNAIFFTNLYSVSGKIAPVVSAFSVFVWSIFITALIIKKKPNKYNLLLTIIPALFLCILFFPAAAAGSWVVEPRFQLIMWTIMIIWLAVVDYNKYIIAAITVISLVFITLVVAINYQGIRQYDKILTEVGELQKSIPDNSTIFYVNLSPYTVDYLNNIINYKIQIPSITGFLTASSCIIEAENYHSSEKNVFPVSYRDEANPFLKMGDFRTVYALNINPPRVDFAAYEQSTGQKLDYIILIGKQEFMMKYEPEHKLDEQELYRNLMKQVDEKFELFKSNEAGFVRIYKRRS